MVDSDITGLISYFIGSFSFGFISSAILRVFIRAASLVR